MPTVLYISRGGQIDGTQRQLYYLLSGLDRHRYNPVVVCNEEGPFLDLLSREGIDSHLISLWPWRKWPGAVQRFSDARKLVSFARRCRVRLIHGSDLWQSGYVCNTARYLNVPAVLHARTPQLPGRLRKYYRPEVSAIIAISRRVRANLIAQGVPEEKVAVIYDAVDLEQFHPRLRKVNILRQEFPQAQGPLLGIVGRISPSKRQLDFLRAAAQIEGTACNHATFFVIGEAEDRLYHQRVRSFAGANGLAQRVIFSGRRNDMPEVLASLDALVTLSGGSVMIEAMACETPVISAVFTPANESTIVQHERTGLLVPSDHAADLKEAIRLLIDQPDLRGRLGRQARQHAETMFSHTDLVKTTQQLYDRLL